MGVALNVVKKLITLVIATLLIFSIVGSAACGNENDYNGKEVTVGNFSLTVTANKTKARVGDTIAVTAVFKNLSGKDIPIELTDWQTYFYLLEQIEKATPLEIVICPDISEWAHISIGVDARHQMTIEKDAVIQQTVEYKIEELTMYKALAGVFFYMGDEYKEFVAIESNPVKIQIVKE